MSRKNLGSVFEYKMRPGKWAAKLTIDGKQVVKLADSKEAAELLLLGLLRQGAKSQPTTSKPAETKPAPKAASKPNAKAVNGTLFSAFAEQWLAASSLKPNTVESYRQVLNSHVLPILGHKALSDITALDIVTVITATRKLGLSDRTVQYAYTVARRVLQVAYDWDLIAINPAAKVKRPKQEAKEHTTWTIEQSRDFLATVVSGSGTWDALFTMALLTGMRLGEIRGLTWADVDFGKAIAKITKSLAELSRRNYVQQTPKTKSSVRIISLPPQVLEALEKWEPDVAKRQGHIFKRKDNGELPSHATLRAAFTWTCKRSGVPYIGIHGLRHMHVSLLAYAGVSVKVAQQRVGHSTAAMTLNIYSHVLDGQDKAAVVALDSLLSA